MTYLGSNFQYILERHTSVGQLTLEHHDDVVVVLVDLLSFCRPSVTLCIALFHKGLQASDLPVDASNILFNDECQFLQSRIQTAGPQCTK